MIDACKGYLTPKRLGIVAYACVILHCLCGIVLTACTVDLRKSESVTFSCTVDSKASSAYKTQVDRSCFFRYDETYNSPLRLYAFVLLSIGLSVLISVIYSLVAWKRVDEIESNLAKENAENRRTVYVFTSYFVHLVLRALLGIILTVLQHAYFYRDGFDSKFSCNLAPTGQVTSSDINKGNGGSRNSTSITCENGTASEKMAWSIGLSVVNSIVAFIILIEVIYLLRRSVILSRHCEATWNIDLEFVTVYFLGKPYTSRVDQEGIVFRTKVLKICIYMQVDQQHSW